MTFSKRLRAALKDRNMKQSVLAYRLGCDRSTISNYLSGRYEAKRETITKIAEVLQVSPQWLAGFDVPRDGLTAPSEPQLNDGEEKLLELFRSVPEQDRDLVLQMIEVALSNKR